MVTAAMKLKDACFLEESYDKPKQCIKTETSLYQQKSISQSYDISSSHVWMWELYHKDWVLKNWSFWTVLLEKTLESSLDSKDIKSVNPKGNQAWSFIGMTDA